jgi:Xaa-Pro aminopeptidase
MGPGAVAIVLGARPVTRSNDTHYPFRQDSDFWYLTGFPHPNAVALLRTDGGPAFTLFVEPREREAEIWNGYRPGVEGAVTDFGADEAHPREELLAKLMGTMQAPVAKLVRTMNEVPGKFVRTLAAVRDAKSAA